MRVFHNALHFRIHKACRVFAEVLVLNPFAANKNFFAGFADGQRAHGFAHAPLADHLAGHAGDAFDVVGGAGGDIVKNDFFRHAATQQHHQIIAQEGARITVAVFFRQLHGHAQGAATRNDRNLVYRIGTGQQAGSQGVTAFVVGGDALFFLGEDKTAAFAAHENLVLGILEIMHVQAVLIELGGLKGSFVDQIFKVGARKARCTASQHFQINIASKRRAFGVHFKNAAAATQIGRGHHDLTVKAARTQQGGIKHIRAVCGGNEDNAFIAFKAVHFHKQLVQGLLAFVMPAAKASATLTANGVDFVNKYQTGRVFLALNKKVANARSAHAHKHFNKVGAGNGEERHPGLASNGAGQKCFTRAGRAHEQHALGDAPAKAGKLFGVGEKFHNFRKLVLGFVNTSHVSKGNAGAVLIEQTSARPAKTHGLAAAALHLAHKENPHSNEQQHGEPGNQQGHVPGLFFRRFGLDFDLFFNKAVYEADVLRSVGLHGFAVRGAPDEGVPLNGHGHELAVVHLTEKI